MISSISALQKKENYSKCPEILYSKVFDKMAYGNSLDPDQATPKGAVRTGATLFAFPQCILTLNQIT